VPAFVTRRDASSIVAELDIAAIEEVGGMPFGYRSGLVIGLWPL
jgi:hypothetical protein